MRILLEAYVAKFVFQFDFSNAFSFRDVMLVFFFKCSKNLDIKMLEIFEVSVSIVSLHQRSSSGCEFFLQF